MKLCTHPIFILRLVRSTPASENVGEASGPVQFVPGVAQPGAHGVVTGPGPEQIRGLFLVGAQVVVPLTPPQIASSATCRRQSADCPIVGSNRFTRPRWTSED